MIETIQRELVLLNELRPEDAADVFNFASHDQVAKTVTWDSHKDVNESLAYITTIQGKICKQAGNIFLAWAVRDVSSQKVIGLVSLTQLGTIRAQVGYVFHYHHWEKKIPIQAIEAIIDYSFTQFPTLERIQARCFPTNTASISLLEKLGMRFEGVNEAMMKVREKVIDLSCYAITRKHWVNHALEQISHSNDDLAEHI